jgi:hypothetical protein
MCQDLPRILLAAEGYLELGMPDHAAQELDKAPVVAATGEDRERIPPRNAADGTGSGPP